jgi:excisionase family DNA binding protein
MQATTEITPAVMNIAQAAIYLRLSRPKVYSMIRSGNLPHCRMDKSIRLRKSDLDKYIEKHVTTKHHCAEGIGRPPRQEASA